MTKRNDIVTKISAKGAVTIPKHIIAATGLAPGDTIRFELTGAGIVLRKANSKLRTLAGLIDMSSVELDAALAAMRGKPCISRRRTKRAGAARRRKGANAKKDPARTKDVVVVPDAAGSLAGYGGKPVSLEKARRIAWGKVIAARKNVD